MDRAVLRIFGVGLVAVLALGGCADRPTTSGPADTTRNTVPDAATGATTAPTPTSPEPSPGVPRTGASVLAVGRNAWVSVAAATLWRSPDSPRVVDAPALEHPVDIVKWLGDMSLAERRALSGRADTQALLGDRVIVLALPTRWPAWARVAVPSQPSPLEVRGYPGWVPRRQLTARAPISSPRRATVVTRTAWLRRDRTDSPRLFRVSFGTSLAVVGETRRFVRVASPAGPVRRFARSAVIVHAAGHPALTPSRASLVRTAKLFVGLPYLWAGVSGFGLDCSGLTWLDYRVHGIRIPRDALPQSRHGRPVSRLHRGDLMFYATDGLVHHVSLYVGHGRMVHSPRTGQRVQVIATSTSPYIHEYAGARRYLP